MQFGQILKNLRKEANYTQEQLADRLGVANSTVSMYERGERFPDYEMMKSIAKLFSVDMNYLYDNKTQANAEDIKEMKFAEILKDLRKQNKVTQDTLAKQLNVSKSTISMYENGERMPPPDMLEAIADRFNVSINYLFGRDDSSLLPKNIYPITRKRFPLLGEIACGEPIFADEDHETYIESSADIKADFCLTAKGDSMIGARIQDGDIVFIREMPMVNNGEIAAVIIDNEATLKRVYYYPDKAKLILNPENPAYEPLVYIGEELNQIRILGRAVSFMSNL